MSAIVDENNKKAATTKKALVPINEALFRQSEWDDYPMKRDDKHTNKIIQPDFAPQSDASTAERLPQGFAFGSINLQDDEAVAKLCAFLNENYDGIFAFDARHVRWILDVPGRREDAVMTVTTKSGDNSRLVGVVCTRPVCYRVDNRVICTQEIGWLCTLRELRGKRLAAVIMKEIYRRIFNDRKDCGVIFAMTRQLPNLPLVSGVKLLHRALSALEPNKNLNLIRFANMRDISRMMKIYQGYRDRWRLHREYTRREFEHTFLRRGDVSTYVCVNERGDVKDFISLATLQKRTIENEKKNERVGLIHFVSFVNEKLLQLFVQNVLYIVSRNGYTGVYIEDLNGTGEVLKEKLGFHEVQTRWYYQFNYNTKEIASNESQFCSLLL